MRNKLLLMIPAGVAVIVVAAVADMRGPREGKQVYDEVCFACHRAGLAGAPRVGDRRAWGPLEARGLSSLTESALAGVRRMPPHGGRLDLSDLEIRRAIAYMVNHSGGRWSEPIDRRHPPPPRTAQAIVYSQCGRCHLTGEGGAPRIGDRDAWIARGRDGMEALVRSAIHGHGGMPPRGGMPELTDDELRAAVTYMYRRGAYATTTGR